MLKPIYNGKLIAGTGYSPDIARASVLQIVVPAERNHNIMHVISKTISKNPNLRLIQTKGEHRMQQTLNGNNDAGILTTILIEKMKHNI